MDQDLKTRILSAVDARFDKQTQFLSELTTHPSTRGNEQSAQAFRWSPRCSSPIGAGWNLSDS